MKRVPTFAVGLALSVASAVALAVASAVALAVPGCASDDDPGAAPADDGALADGTVGETAEADAFERETSDAADSSSAIDGASDAGVARGDRNLGIRETYPDSFFLQNGGRIYDVKSPPNSTLRAAKGDGITDDTEALRDAYDYVKKGFVDHASWAYAGGPIIYLPEGTYRVSDTIIYRGASLEAPTGYDWVDVVGVRFVGESREKTILQLADGASGFGDAKTPKIVLAYQHPDTRFNNIPANNALRNLTIDVGHGNGGAVGVYFQGANLTAMTNVLVRSGDGAGRYGFWFKIGSAQGDYHDLTVEGFDYGIFQNQAGEVDTSFEHVTLRSQHVAAVVAGGGLSGRDLFADETATGAQAVRVQEDGSQLVILDSRFEGSGKGAAIECVHDTKQSMFLRSVTTIGYGNAVTRGATIAVSGPDVDEWSALPTLTLFDSGVAKTLNLPIEDSPLVAWGDPSTEWANVDDYGAIGDGKADDAAAIQKAMKSGKPVVVFRKAAYAIGKSIDIPATVQRVDVLYSDIGNASFNVSEASTKPLLIERGGAYGTVTLKAARPLVLREMSGRFSNDVTTPSKVYIENMANVGATPNFAPSSETLWARSLNDENAAPTPTDILIHGGTAWMFNYKTENKPVTSLRAESGATVEVFNGYVNSTSDAGATPMIVNDHSRMSFVGFTNLGFFKWVTTIEELRASGTETVTPAMLPARDDHTDLFIPLYAGDGR